MKPWWLFNVLNVFAFAVAATLGLVSGEGRALEQSPPKGNL